jgi:hypothetical protein
MTADLQLSRGPRTPRLRALLESRRRLVLSNPDPQAPQKDDECDCVA